MLSDLICFRIIDERRRKGFPNGLDGIRSFGSISIYHPTPAHCLGTYLRRNAGYPENHLCFAGHETSRTPDRFFSVLIWLVAITQIFNNLTRPIYYFAYAGGFAMGNLVGILIEEKVAIGTVVIRIITQKDAAELLDFLKDRGFGVTQVNARGAMGPVKIIFTIIKRKEIEKVLQIIRQLNLPAFYTIEDVRSVKSVR